MKFKKADNFTLVYNNIKIRPLQISDIEYLREWRNNPANSKYLRNIGYISEEAQRKWFENYIKNEDEMTFAIDEIEELNRIVGSVSLYNFKGNQVTFGKILVGDEDAHGKNVGYNATKAVLDIAFRELSIEEVVLECYADNKTALHIYKKAGFQITGEHLTEENKIEYYLSINKNNFEKIN